MAYLETILRYKVLETRDLFFCGVNRNFITQKGKGLFTLGCICTLYLKCIFDIFENIKNSKQKCFVYMTMFYVPTKLFQQKQTFYMIYVKMTKFDTKIGFFAMHVFASFA
jgi:hypothetical protein